MRAFSKHHTLLPRRSARMQEQRAIMVQLRQIRSLYDALHPVEECVHADHDMEGFVHTHTKKESSSICLLNFIHRWCADMKRLFISGNATSGSNCRRESARKQLKALRTSRPWIEPGPKATNASGEASCGPYAVPFYHSCGHREYARQYREKCTSSYRLPVGRDEAGGRPDTAGMMDELYAASDGMQTAGNPTTCVYFFSRNIQLLVDNSG